MAEMTLMIDGAKVCLPEGISLLEAAKKADIEIPTLCYYPDFHPEGVCGICVVEVEGEPVLKRACVTEAKEGMQVKTHTREVREARKNILELVLASHPEDCLECIRHGSCELQTLAEKFEIRKPAYQRHDRGLPVDLSSKSIVRDMNKCIGCGRCITACQKVQSVYAIEFHQRGSHTVVSPAEGYGMGDSVCVNCGQCIMACPVGALYEQESIEAVWQALDNPRLETVVQVAPAVRVALGEEFGLKPGELVIGKIYTALKMLDFKRVFDTNFSADLTIMEEGAEFLNRLESGGPFPLITSCSPGWVKFAETFFPDFIENLSTAKSPQQMLGALAKTYYPESRGLKPEDIFSVSVMPCTAKKFERQRPEMCHHGCYDVDEVLTTRELARMIRQAGIRFETLPESAPDPLLSSYTGAATLFGATGGVMEAALRTAVELKTGKPLSRLEFTEVRGLKGIKEAKLEVNGIELRIAVGNTLANARKLLERVREAKAKGEILYHFIEIMACPGGCIGGGGQPIPSHEEKRRQRMEGLYTEDRGLALRKSHENPEVKRIYETYLKKPGGERSHHLLHTGYEVRDPYR